MQIDFPEVSVALRERYGLEGLSLRPFRAAHAQLEVDFTEENRPALVTRLLSKCAADSQGRPLPDDFLWSLPVGKRLQCLLLISSLAGWSVSTVAMPCPLDGCSAEIEAEIPLMVLAGAKMAGDQASHVALMVDGTALRVRLPTGSDQKAWNADPPSDLDALERLIEDELDREEIAKILPHVENALVEYDPLIDCKLRTHCPECGRGIELHVDLQSVVLSVIRREQEGLVDVVHRLAWSYHWSEEEILKLPSWRRQRYLHLVEREVV